MSYTETMLEYVYDQYSLSYNMEDVCNVIYLCSPSPVNRNRENCLEEYIKYIRPSENL